MTTRCRMDTKRTLAQAVQDHVRNTAWDVPIKEVDVPDSWRDPGDTPEQPRWRECYLEACRYMQYAGFHTDEDPVLIHGYVLVHETPIHVMHGWVEIGDVVYDGVAQRFFDKEDYYRVRDAHVVASYTLTEMWEHQLRYRHHGTWWEETRGGREAHANVMRALYPGMRLGTKEDANE